MYAYIDPGTGSMLFTIIVGVATAAFFALKGLLLKLSFLLHGGRKQAQASSDAVVPYVIFSDSKRYWNIFKPVCDEFEKRGIDAEYWTMSPDDPALSAGYGHIHCTFIGEGNAAFAKLNVMKADICLATTPGLDVYQWKRSKNVRLYVHITHDVCSITSYRMFGVDFYDAILLPNREILPELREIEKLRNLPEKDVEIVGSTYMDGLKRQAEKYPGTKKAGENLTVLVAPSWGASCLLNRYGRTFLNALKDTGYNIIVRPHPQSFTSDAQLMEELQKEFPDSGTFSWNRDNDNFSVMSRADILISDFSGIIFDYAFTFGRPVIYADTKLDLAPYDDCWLSNTPWKLRIISELCRKLNEDQFGSLKSYIKDTIEDKSYGKKREEIRKAAWEYEGQAAVRVTDYLVSKHIV